MALVFYPNESESALDIITRALELDPKAGIELTAKNLIVRFSDRTTAESWKSERDVASLTTKWFSNRYHQNQTRDKNILTDISSEQVTRLQHQVDFLTQELNSLKETVANLVEMKPTETVPEVPAETVPEVPAETVPEVPAETVPEVVKKTRGRKKTVPDSQEAVEDAVVKKTRGRKRTT